MSENIEALDRTIKRWVDLSINDKNQLIKKLYPELKRIASIQLNKNQRKLTQSTTEIVNEAFIKIAGQNSLWNNEKHFFAIAATIMRRIIVDLTRKKLSRKQGEGIELLDIDNIEIAVPFNFSNWLVLNDAIEKLDRINPILTRVFELRAIMGLNIEETSDVLEISLSTVSRHWKFSRAWLADYLSKS